MSSSQNSRSFPTPVCPPRRFLPFALLALFLALGIPRAAATEPASTLTKTVLPAGDAAGRMTSAQCLACHPTDVAFSHPVQVAPTMTIPDALPLEDGQITCITCHCATPSAHAAGQNTLLRGTATGPAFCAQCHTAQSLTRAGRHPSATSRAHLLWPADAPVSAASPANDDGVNSCLACHDGTVAPDAFAGLHADPGSMAGTRAHPVGIAYPSVTLHVGDATFRSAIDHRVRLNAGQVTCNSCHSPYSPQPALLVMRNDRSALCVCCHAR